MGKGKTERGVERKAKRQLAKQTEDERKEASQKEALAKQPGNIPLW
jgi:hypothetical protein